MVLFGGYLSKRPVYRRSRPSVSGVAPEGLHINHSWFLAVGLIHLFVISSDTLLSHPFWLATHLLKLLLGFSLDPLQRPCSLRS